MNWVYRIDSNSCYPRQSADNYIRARKLFEDYLKQNGYILSYNSYYKWDYIKITTIHPYTELPYNPGDEIYFVPGIELDEFRSMPVAANWTYFRFVDKNHFFKWGRPKSDSDATPVQFKNLNIGDIFKIPNREFLYLKVDPINTGHCKWPAVVLTGDRKGYTIMLGPETYVERCTGDSSLKELASKYLKDDKDSFMAGSAPYDKLPNDPVNYTMADVRNTLQFLALCQDYKRISTPCVKKVIFNDPATIVFWEDGSKTVVKCQNGEKYDKEKGLALCYMKKILGNQGNFNNVFREWIKPEVTAVYDEKHPELGIQELPPKGKKVLPSGRYRIRTAELSIIDCYLTENKLTYKQIAIDTGLSTKTIKRVLRGQPMSSYTKFCLADYFDFPIGFTRYAED